MATTSLDPRIGKLNNGNYYCFASGYSGQITIGTLAEVERALGIPQPPEQGVILECDDIPPGNHEYDVTIALKSPAWNSTASSMRITAKDREGAIGRAREIARNSGHTRQDGALKITASRIKK